MSRPKNNPDFDREKLETEILQSVVEVYTSEKNTKKTVSYVADMLGITALKARKLLITAGDRAGDPSMYYSTPLSDAVQYLYNDIHRTIEEIGERLELSHASVVGYLPYTKTVYSMKQLGVDAERIKRFRERQRAVGKLFDCVTNTQFLSDVEEEETDLIEASDESCKSALWSCITLFQNYKFRTSGRGTSHSGAVDFTYTLKISKRTGEVTDELIISTCPEGKSITRSSVELAFKNAISIQGRDGYVKGPLIKVQNIPSAVIACACLWLHTCDVEVPVDCMGRSHR